jgi:hypothetical protein
MKKPTWILLTMVFLRSACIAPTAEPTTDCHIHTFSNGNTYSFTNVNTQANSDTNRNTDSDAFRNTDADVSSNYGRQYIQSDNH